MVHHYTIIKEKLPIFNFNSYSGSANLSGSAEKLNFYWFRRYRLSTKDFSIAMVFMANDSIEGLLYAYPYNRPKKAFRELCFHYRFPWNWRNWLHRGFAPH